MNCTPAVTLYGDPGTDQQTLLAGNYVGGIIVALVTTGFTYTGNSYAYAIQPTNQPAFGALGNIVPCDRKSTDGKVPFATLLNNGGEFAGAIGPSGSKKAPVVRAMWQGMVDNQAYAGTITDFKIGAFLYCGYDATSGKYVPSTGAYTTDISGGNEVLGAVRVGICTHVPTAAEPWLGVASLL